MHKGILGIVTLIIGVMFTSQPFAYAVEKAERITDREIIEALAQIRGDIKELRAEIKATNQRIDDMNNSVNRRFDDVMRYLQILTVAIFVVIGWLVVQWKKLVKIEQRQKQFETQDDEIKFLKEAYNKLNDMVVRILELLKKPPKEIL